MVSYRLATVAVGLLAVGLLITAPVVRGQDAEEMRRRKGQIELLEAKLKLAEKKTNSFGKRSNC
jgi:hypothetical protein